jgi:hypothetical protein
MTLGRPPGLIDRHTQRLIGRHPCAPYLSIAWGNSWALPDKGAPAHTGNAGQRPASTAARGCAIVRALTAIQRFDFISGSPHRTNAAMQHMLREISHISLPMAGSSTSCAARFAYAAADDIPRFFVPAIMAPGHSVQLPAAVDHHARRVLRLRAGDWPSSCSTAKATNSRRCSRRWL